MLLGWAVVVFAFHHTEFAARMGLLVCAFSAVQLVYFFGRSHDHNLLNISGVWLLVIFLAVDQAKEFGRARAFASAVLIVALITMSTRQFLPKLERIGDRLTRGVWIEPVASDASLDALRGTVGANTIFVDPADAYLNYRLGVPQRGFYVPFEANVFIADTASWMDEQIRAGMRILTTDRRWSSWVQEFNDSSAMKQRGRHFEVIPAGSFLEIVAKSN